MRKFTLICHKYIGYGSYVINLRRIQCVPKNLGRYLKKDQTIHFVIKGWPLIWGADGVTLWDFGGLPKRQPSR